MLTEHDWNSFHDAESLMWIKLYVDPLFKLRTNENIKEAALPAVQDDAKCYNRLSGKDRSRKNKEEEKECRKKQ